LAKDRSGCSFGENREPMRLLECNNLGCKPKGLFAGIRLKATERLKPHETIGALAHDAGGRAVSMKDESSA
jgi:hypothetical protein